MKDRVVLKTQNTFFNKLSIILVFIILIHNIEEGLTMKVWANKYIPLLPLNIQKVLPYQLTSNFGTQIIISLFLVTLIMLLFVIFFIKSQNILARHALMLIAVIMLINVFQHVFVTIYFQNYSPGVVTAVFLNLPFFSYFLYKSYTSGYVTKSLLLRLFPLAIFVTTLGLILTWKISAIVTEVLR